MMLLLVQDVADDGVELRAGVGERAEAFLPGKPAGHPSLAFDETRRAGLDVANQVRKRQIRLQPNEQPPLTGRVYRTKGRRQSHLRPLRITSRRTTVRVAAVPVVARAVRL